jgi:hypothetical protein
MIWARDFIRRSSDSGQVGDETGVEPFLLNTETEHRPSRFEWELFIGETRYRYGFEADSKQVHSEWLIAKAPGKHETELFTRENQHIELHKSFPEGIGLESRTRENALFLSVCGQFNGTKAAAILKWLKGVRSISGISDAGHLPFTAKMVAQPPMAQSILDVVKLADLGICHLKAQVREMTEAELPEDLPAELKKEMLKRFREVHEFDVRHTKFDADGKEVGEVAFDFESQESEGTKKFVAMTGPFLHTLAEGSILIVDEFEARLHPLLTRALLALFHGRANARNAQIIFATHDVLVMEPERLRRDQIWFTEKDRLGGTTLYCLDEFDAQKVRHTTKFNRQYLLGVFGAVPRIPNVEQWTPSGTP